MKRLVPLFAILCVLVERFVVSSEAPVVIQWVLIGALGLTISSGISRGLDRLLPGCDECDDTVALSAAVLLHSLAWGRAQFIGAFDHDEWGYFATVGQNWAWRWHWLFQPLNEHFQPLFKLVALVVYGGFGTSYLGVALVSFALFVLLLHSLYRLVRRLTGSREVAACAAGLLAVWPAYGEVVQWKAAGLPLFLSGAFFLLALTAAIDYVEVGLGAGISLGCATVAVFSSSLVTIFPLYLLAFLPLLHDSRQLKRWLGLTVGAIAISLAYFVLRNGIFHVPMPVGRSLDWRVPLGILGSFVKKDFLRIPGGSDYGWGVITAILLAGAAAAMGCAWARTRRPSEERRLALLGLGGSILLLASVQLYLGRGLDFEEFPGSRHYFPHAIGLVLVISALLSLGAYFRESRGWRVVAMIGLLAVPALAHQEFQPLAEIREINGVRSQFFDALNAAICAVHFEQVSRPHLIRLPDFPLSDVRADLRIRPPFDQERYGFTLEYYARISLNSCADHDLIRFSPMNRSRDRSEFAEALALPEVYSFYAKYFPEGSGAPRK